MSMSSNVSCDARNLRIVKSFSHSERGGEVALLCERNWQNLRMLRALCVSLPLTLCWNMSQLFLRSCCSILAIFFILILNHLIRLPSPVVRTRSRHEKPFFFISLLPLTSISLFSPSTRVFSLSEKHFLLRAVLSILRFDNSIFFRFRSSRTVDGTQAKWCFSSHDLSPTYFHTFFCQTFLRLLRYYVSTANFIR